VLAFGLTEDFEPLLREALSLFPKSFFCHFQVASRPVFIDVYEEEKLGTHLKMKLRQFNPADDSDNQAIGRLEPSDFPTLHQLYERAYPGHYFDEKMLTTGKYFGWFESGKIIGVAGIHVFSPEHKIAVLGNITVDLENRGRGIATKLTSRLVQELLPDTDTICLNVRADNESARTCYLKLGFETVCEYEEAKFSLK
jgi:ribosomal protein S18 acetylase RimI-like enzyme